MLVRTSSGNTSVGHLSHSPHGFSKLHRPDVSFQCGGLIFPVHSLLLSVSSRFFTDFFTFVCGKMPEIISLDAVKCEALSAISLSYYLDFVYGGMLPDCDTMSEALELLRLAEFFGNAPLMSQLSQRIVEQLAGLDESQRLQVFKIAADLKLRHLVTECLALLLPQFGKPAADSTVPAAIEHMDATLSKAVLTQLAMHGPAAFLPSAGQLFSSSCGSESVRGSGLPHNAAMSSLGRTDSAGDDVLGPAACHEQLERMKQEFVRVLEAKGWGSI